MIFVENINALPALHLAAFMGDKRGIQAAIESGTAVDIRANTAQDYGWFLHNVTPLMVAAGSPNKTVSAMRLLLSLGADPLAKSSGEVSALWYAVSSGDSSRVQLLLEATNYSIEFTNNGIGVINEAAEAGDLASVNLLLNAGASPHPFGKADGYTNAAFYEIPLFSAARGGNAACVEALIRAGVPAIVSDNDKQTALAYATTADVVAMLVKSGCPLNVFDRYGYSELDAALEAHREDVVRALVAAGTSLEMRNQGGLPVLIRHCGSLEIKATMVQLLIELGADIFARVYQDSTALHLATHLITGDRHGVLGDVVKVLVIAGITC
ncbi:MAG: ankyrin repeat domain-containing protein [Chloroflexota bacterium]